MGVEIELHIWEPSKTQYAFVFVLCFLSLFYLPVKTTSNVFDHASSASFHRFQRNFLALFALSSVIQGSLDVFGEYEFAFYGVNKDQILRSLCVGYAASLMIGSYLGVFSDLIGHRRSCLLFLLLHLFVRVWKILAGNSAIWLTCTCLSLASSLFSFSFETWMVVEHNKLGPRQGSLNDMFWLMTFFECASFIGSQVVGNYLINVNPNKSTSHTWKEIFFLVLAAIITLGQGWKENHEKPALEKYIVTFRGHVSDKRIWLIGCAQACVHFSTTVFWILWAPAVVADGRQVSLGLIYPCLLGFKMFGSTCFPWFHGPLAFRVEDYLIYAFVAMGVTLSVVAYDYQDIEVLMILFYIYHACSGVVLPSLAKLRTIYVPNKVRGGMMCILSMPANAALLLLLLLRYHHPEYIENSMMLALAALAMFLAAGCILMLKRWGKQLHQSNHTL